MGGLLGELGKKLAERWLTLLVLPGALYCAVVAAGVALGYGHPFDLGRLVEQVGVWAKEPAVRTTGGQVVVLAVVLAAAAGVGLAAQALGSLIEGVALAAGWRSWPAPVRRIAEWRVAARRTRWEHANGVYQEKREEAGRQAAEGCAPADLSTYRRARAAVAVEAPDRPTWCGDRVHAVDVRLFRDLYLDFKPLWPLLWLNLPEGVRAEVGSARDALARAAVLGGWALLYLPLAGWWWPALFVAVAVGATARYRFRVGADAYAQALESTVRLYVVELATRLGLSPTGPADVELGHALTHYLRTGRSVRSEPTPEGS